jgi:hypothetical protein
MAQLVRTVRWMLGRVCRGQRWEGRWSGSALGKSENCRQRQKGQSGGGVGPGVRSGELNGIRPAEVWLGWRNKAGI